MALKYNGFIAKTFISSVEYVNEFSDMAPMLRTSKKDKSNSAARKEPEIVNGPPFEPSYVYKMLASMSGEMFTEGRQQDAEEMLSVVLNGLHDEVRNLGIYIPSDFLG